MRVAENFHAAQEPRHCTAEVVSLVWAMIVVLLGLIGIVTFLS